MLTDLRYLPYGMIEQIRANHNALIEKSEQTIKELYALKQDPKGQKGE